MRGGERHQWILKFSVVVSQQHVLSIAWCKIKAFFRCIIINAFTHSQSKGTLHTGSSHDKRVAALDDSIGQLEILFFSIAPCWLHLYYSTATFR